MFRRKPRYLIDENGELRHIYHRESNLFPYFGRALRPDKPNLRAVQINGKWVLVEIDGNEQKKTVELQHTVRRRQGFFGATIGAAVCGAAAWNGPFGYQWIGLAKTWLVDVCANFGLGSFPLSVVGAVVYPVGLCICLVLAYFALRFALTALKFLVLEILYWLRFPFMKGARATLLPKVPRSAAGPLATPWNAGFADPWEAAAQIGKGGQPKQIGGRADTEKNSLRKI